MKKSALRLSVSVLCVVAYILLPMTLSAQPVLETGGQTPMPNEWIDKDTHHKVVCLSRIEGNSQSFYFHNNPFLTQKTNEGDRMVFYNTGPNGKQAYTVNLKTLKIEQITNQNAPMTGEIVGHRTHDVYYQTQDSVFSFNIETKKTLLVFVFPADFKGSITTLNADETLLAGGWADSVQLEIRKQYPEKSQFFTRIFNAKALNKLFTLNIKTKELKIIHEDHTWLNHIQFSPTLPNLLMFCHEGPWNLVDRIWTIDLKTNEVVLMHKRTMENEIAGHEFFSPDGKTIWFDLQMPRSTTFYLAGCNVQTHQEIKYEMTRNEWSIHFNVTPDMKLFCGDGGDPGQVARATDGMWLYLFKPNGDHFESTRLVNMKNHNYKFEPNVHFTPDQKWIIFRANFDGGIEKVYAVELAESKVQ